MAETYSTGILDTQKVNATFASTGHDASGNVVPAPVSNPSWVVTTGDVTLAPASDNSNCDIIAGADGVSTVTLTATAANGNTLTAVITVTVTAGVISADTLNVTFGTPTAK